MNLSQCVNWRSRNDVMGHFRPIDNVYAMSAYPPTAVELSQRSEPPLRATNDISHRKKRAGFLPSLHHAVGHRPPF